MERQKSVPFDFDGLHFDEGLRVDLLVERCLVIELKSVENLAPVHAKQLLTYLRLLNLPVGLLINFGAATFKEGVKRVVNNHRDFASSRLRVNLDLTRSREGREERQTSIAFRDWEHAIHREQVAGWFYLSAVTHHEATA